jgi:hypothetical protein
VLVYKKRHIFRKVRLYQSQTTKYMFGNISLGYFDFNLKASSINNRSCFPRISQKTLTCAAQTASPPLLAGLLEQAKVISR